ncbi:MAG TPA: MoaD/ThiS family protein [Terriglobia bacterium]|nr:MoaD/ThiS family protein [Terriglobia bacterium]
MPAVRVRIAALLSSYTSGLKVIEIDAATVGEAMAVLDRRFPGLAFRVIDEQGRIRPHMNVFLGEEKVLDLATPIARDSEIYIVGALSGGAGETKI